VRVEGLRSDGGEAAEGTGDVGGGVSVPERALVVEERVRSWVMEQEEIVDSGVGEYILLYAGRRGIIMLDLVLVSRPSMASATFFGFHLSIRPLASATLPTGPQPMLSAVE